jgi:predicted lipoprotein with Yx(FWY)xxD motif
MCKRELPRTAFYKARKAKDGLQSSCKKCLRLYSNARRAKLMADPTTAEIQHAKERAWVDARRTRSPEKMKATTTNSLLRKTYGLTLREFDEISAAQNDVCAICSNKCPDYSRLSVDHNHVTGQIRGLLCNRCNRAMGLFQDDPEILRKAAAYLEKAAATAPTTRTPLTVVT